MSEQYDLTPFIGREQSAHDIVDPERLIRLAALLDRSWTPSDAIPPLGHFLLFRPDERQSNIGPDGHPVRGPDDLLPDIPLPRRMWAGSRIRFERALEPGMPVFRKSRLEKAVAKRGKGGDLVFCTVAHEIRAGEGGPLLIAEEQDIVYRGAHTGAEPAKRPSIDPDFTAQEVHSRVVGPVELFRYSALTFNAHRIHYDRDYARDEEGYPALVVHGPFLATLLFDHLQNVTRGRRISAFAFRATSPSFDGEELVFGATVQGDEAKLSVTNPSGLALTGTARLADG
ncbi:hypothetical protein [Hyphomonas johnsonii]|uniref:N-terminal of MaoC-like dehydratase domain-containing protein n=1 Tax=Hyphomonas johnsonii MHS-2 TaxID=1280950 RepID=A0A059FU66_9PROT|nr:hypothetical protein [Hyphomonas johnsonii]KCZ94219.1 hypothetical protein HJO_02555 [Hyphomonas johnsonii MHS-2]